MNLTPDLAARKILVAAYLYYNHDRSIMSDGEYDKLSQYVANHWDELPPIRQWCLGSAEATRATGMHFKFTTYCTAAARHLVGPLPADNEFYDETHRVHYTVVTG